jgi:hypothetical protein
LFEAAMGIVAAREELLPHPQSPSTANDQAPAAGAVTNVPDALEFASTAASPQEYE